MIDFQKLDTLGLHVYKKNPTKYNRDVFRLKHFHIYVSGTCKFSIHTIVYKMIICCFCEAYMYFVLQIYETNQLPTL